MTEQLSLFKAPEDRTTEGLAAAPADTGAVDELLRLNRHWRSGDGFRELLDFIARLTAYSPLNGFLIYLQDPAATRVATPGMWARKYQRRLRPGARPIVILAPMSPVLFVFDIRDTEGPVLPLTAPPASGSPGRLPPRWLDTTLHNCGIQHIAVRDTLKFASAGEAAIRLTSTLRKKYVELGLESNSRYLVRLESGLTPEAKYRALVLELGRIFCGHLGIDGDAWWPDRKDLNFERTETEAAAVTYLVCRRRGLAASPGGALNECIQNGKELPLVSLNVVFQAANHIETMGRRAWKKARKQGRY